MTETKVISPRATAFLVERLRAGDAAAFTEIYDAYADKLVAWSFDVLQN